VGLLAGFGVILLKNESVWFYCKIGCGCKSQQHDRMWCKLTTTRQDVDVSHNNMTGCGCKSQHDRMWM
jgi:hypothetical protein